VQADESRLFQLNRGHALPLFTSGSYTLTNRPIPSAWNLRCLPIGSVTVTVVVA
jgi:hypothetical protein